MARKRSTKPAASRRKRSPAKKPYTLALGDCVELMAALDEDSVDAIVCDPPYGLEFMGKEWDSFRVDPRAARWQAERSGGAGAGFAEAMDGKTTLPAFGKRRTTRMCRTCGKRDAFMNPHDCGDKADWVQIPVDETPIEMRAFQNWCALWAVEAYRVLKPGGHLLAFGGTRTYHRLACALEEVGFEIRDSLHWIYGSGFPKSLDVSKAIDKRAGAEREVVGQRMVTNLPADPEVGTGELVSGTGRYTAGMQDVTAPTTDEAKQWAGWGTALKPSHEPVVMARKPLMGTVAENVLKHGTGGLNIGETAVGPPAQLGQTMPKFGTGSDEKRTYGEVDAERVEWEPPVEGRWPANVVLEHLAECKGSGPHHTDVLCAPGCPVAEMNEMSGIWGPRTAVRRNLEDGTMPEEGRAGQELVTYRLARQQGPDVTHDGGGAARFFYVFKARSRERIGGTMRNLHPTVKPVELMRYLVRLVTPPGGLVLDPFMGSGSTGCACMAEGFRFLGYDQDAESFETAKARIGDWHFAERRPR